MHHYSLQRDGAAVDQSGLSKQLSGLTCVNDFVKDFPISPPVRMDLSIGCEGGH